MHNCLSAKGFGLVVALGLSLGASARAEQPNLGLWWQVGANGKFMQLQVGPGGYALATLSFEEAGAPTYRVMQGPLVELDPRDPAEMAIAELRSPLYRVDRAGCLACDEQTGTTVTEEARPYRLRFTSTSKAQLQTADGQLINYEFFPLLTQPEDLTAYRISGKRAVLENRGHAALVELRPTTVDPDCGVQFSPGEQAYRVEILPGQPEAGALGGVLNSVDLVIDNVQNPRIRLLGRKDLYDIRCVQFVHGGCGQYEFTFIGTQCAIAANLYESGQRLFGHAERIDPDRSYLLPPIQFGGDIRLTILE